MPSPAAAHAEPSTPRRPWGSLARRDIVSTALDIARREGLEALTMRRLATELGASRMALYRHVADKEELLDLIANAVAEDGLLGAGPSGESPGPDGDWRDRLRGLARGMRTGLLLYPGLAALIMTRGNHSPGGLRLAESILTALTDAGLDDDATARYYLVFVDLVLGRADRELHGDPTSPGRNAGMFAAALQAEETPRLRALTSRLSAATPEMIFTAEIDMFLAAVEAAAR